MRTPNRRGELTSEQLFHMAKIALVLLVVLLVIGSIAYFLFKPELLPFG